MAINKTAAYAALETVTGFLQLWRGRGIAAEWMIIPTALEVGDQYVLRSEWTAGYQNAWIYVNTEDEIVRTGGARLNYMVLHELVHLMLAPVEDVIDTELNQKGGSLHGRFSLAVETVTDRVAAALWRAYEGDNLF